MRVLSQDGRIDLPYENIGISINSLDNKEIIAYPTGGYSYDDKYWSFARYSNELKAKRALEMLHEAYCGVVHMKHADYDISDIDLSQEIEKKIGEEMSKSKFLTTIPNPVIECKIFQFPSDDEVEV